MRKIKMIIAVLAVIHVSGLCAENSKSEPEAVGEVIVTASKKRKKYSGCSCLCGNH